MDKQSELKVGMYVNHKQFGRGRILKISQKTDDMVIEVSFLNYGIRKLSLNNTKSLEVEKEKK